MSILNRIFKGKDSGPGHAISVQQGVAANALSIQALINVLVEKKVCSREELLDELKKISGQNQQHVQLKK
jgi:hypothetical protein